jgi:hypothetical protein
MRWPYTKSLCLAAVAATAVGAVGRYLLGDPKWDGAFASLFWIPVLGGLVCVPLDLISYFKERRARGRQAGTGPSQFG